MLGSIMGGIISAIGTSLFLRRALLTLGDTGMEDAADLFAASAFFALISIALFVQMVGNYIIGELSKTQDA